jgi:hypothetical protein
VTSDRAGRYVVGWPSPTELITSCRGEFVVDSVTALDETLPGTDTVGSSSSGRAAPSGPPVVGFVVALMLLLFALVEVTWRVTPSSRPAPDS